MCNLFKINRQTHSAQERDAIGEKIIEQVEMLDPEGAQCVIARLKATSDPLKSIGVAAATSQLTST